MATETIQLMSSDGQLVEVPVSMTDHSTTIKNVLADMDDDEGGAIPLPNIEEGTLKKCVEFFQLTDSNGGFAEKEEGEPKNTDQAEWVKTFFADVEKDMLFKIILAANYLDAKNLLDEACKTVALMLKGKTPEEIRTEFDIKNDFTPEEEEQIRKENEWCEEATS